MIPGIVLLLGIAVVDWVAVAKGWKRVEYICKPATMVILFALLAFVGGFSSKPLVFIGAGLLLSLVGDVFLMLSYRQFSDRWFLPGLSAFLLAHIAYIIGLNIPLPAGVSLWSMGMAVVLALAAGRVLRRIVAGIRLKKLHRMTGPVVLYGMVITLMLLSAMITLTRKDWNSLAAGMVCLGASLFYLSDVILAWGKFVNPVRNGRLANMITYHLGQFLLVVGAILQFMKK